MLRLTLSAACIALFLAALPARASRSTTPDDSEQLLEHMEGLKENLKGVAMSLQGTDTSATLRHVAEMQRLVLLAKLLAPSNLDEQPAADQDKHRVEFRSDLIGLLKELADMELEILAGKPADAFKRVTGSLYKMREEAHAAYQRSE